MLVLPHHEIALIDEVLRDYYNIFLEGTINPFSKIRFVHVHMNCHGRMNSYLYFIKILTIVFFVSARVWFIRLAFSTTKTLHDICNIENEHA